MKFSIFRSILIILLCIGWYSLCNSPTITTNYAITSKKTGMYSLFLCWQTKTTKLWHSDDIYLNEFDQNSLLVVSFKESNENTLVHSACKEQNSSLNNKYWKIAPNHFKHIPESLSRECQKYTINMTFSFQQITIIPLLRFIHSDDI